MKGIMKDAGILFLITLIAGLALGLVHEITLEPIARTKAAAAAQTYQEVMAEAAEFAEEADIAALVEQANAEYGFGIEKVRIDSVIVAKDEAGNDIGYVINATSSSGYNGDVSISVGISSDGSITGLGFLKLAETPGLGMNASKPEFKGQFAGKSAEASLEAVGAGDAASDSQFNKVSGASYTSGAVRDAVNASIYFLNYYIY